MNTFITIPTLILGFGLAATSWPTSSMAQGTTSNALAWSTNGPAVFALSRVGAANAALNGQPAQPGLPPNAISLFDHFQPLSLNNLVWTNFIAHTNNRDMAIWSVRSHSPGWPATPPVAVWNTNSLLWGMKGATALSPCWQVESGVGQVPVTALTRRHGYTRGHGMGSDGFNTNFAGKRVWFVTAENLVVEATVLRDVVRTYGGGANRDYTILLFSHDLPAGIEPLRVGAAEDVLGRYSPAPNAPWPIFKTEQGGYVSADVPGFSVNTLKGGDSGSPNMVPMPGELLFIAGRSTSGPSPQMQADMDELCKQERLDPKDYQLRWVDVSGYPVY